MVDSTTNQPPSAVGGNTQSNRRATPARVWLRTAAATLGVLGLALAASHNNDPNHAVDGPRRMARPVGSGDTTSTIREILGLKSHVATRRATREIAPAAVVIVSFPTSTTGRPTGPGSAPAVPLAQIGVGAPGAGAGISFGAGDGSCTGATTPAGGTGDCPPPSGNGPVNVGGAPAGPGATTFINDELARLRATSPQSA